MDCHQHILPVFLTPAPETGIYITEQQAHQQLTASPASYIDYLDQAFGKLAAGHLLAEFPPKQILVDRIGNGDFRVMPCSTENQGRACKTVKIVGTNLAQKKVAGQITVGKAFVLDSTENFITHTVEACLLSSARTGACAILAVKKTVAADEIAIVGCGRVGYYAALYALAALPVRRLLLADCDDAKSLQLCDHFSAMAPHADIRATTVAEALSARVVILATTSRTPIVSPGNCSAELVVSLGADADDQSELVISWADLQDIEILVDTHDCQRFGDLKAWLSAGRLKSQTITDLVGVYSGRRPGRSGNGRILFFSTGSALFDNLTLRYLLNLDGSQD